MQATSTRRALRVTVAAWITILLLTGCFQFYRDAISDGIVFLAMAVALIVGRTGILRRFDELGWQPRRVVVVIALAVAAAVLMLTPRHGIADGVIIAASGILVLLVAWPDPMAGGENDGAEGADGAWTSRLRRTAIAWAILGIVFCIWELGMYFLGYGTSGRTEYPALSDLLDPLIDNPIGRAAFVAAWFVGGVALTRRGRVKRL